MIRKIEIERFSLVSSKAFDAVVGAINAAIGHPDMPEFWRSVHETASVAELERTGTNPNRNASGTNSHGDAG